MSLIRKALWPTAIVAGLLMFFGAIGSAPSTVYAAQNDVCSITDEDGNELLGEDDFVMAAGETVDFWAYFENVYPDGGEDIDVDVDLDDEEGDSAITSLFGEDAGPTDHANTETAEDANVCGLTDEELEDNLAGDIGDTLGDCIDGDIGPGCEEDDWDELFQDTGLTPQDVADFIAAVYFDDHGIICNDLEEEVRGFMVEDHGANGNLADDLADEIQALCNNGWFEPDFGHEGYVLVDVTCDDPGEFDLSFSPEDFGDDGQIHVLCVGDVDDAEISALPGSVEIIPAFNNVSHSLITVTLEDELGEPSWPGNDVLFTTDRCAIEGSGVDTADEYTAAKGDFASYSVLVANSSDYIEDSDAAAVKPDSSSRQQDEVESFSAGGNTVAAVVLACNPVDAPGVTPGVATITAYINRSGDDLVRSTTVTVVGPVVSDGITVTATPEDGLICGEKATIDVELLDAAGQPVSDHSVLEAVTNFGGVLGGTGAVAGSFGPVVPVSSTVAETFGGKATFYLLTSDTHEGSYEVVITTGGANYVASSELGGYLTAAPLSVQVTVECSAPAAPVPTQTITAPSTGGGITPPSTGDAGLAASSDAGVSLWVIAAGALALVVASVGVVAPKFFRN